MHHFEVSSPNRKRNDSYKLMKKLKQDLASHGIEKDIEEYPDKDLPY
jgi:hypothetical protein